jgi:cystathionine beta-lyase
MGDVAEPDLATVIALEQRLLEPAVRRDRAALTALLHEDFSEFGASGRAYDRAGVIEALLGGDGGSAQAFDFQATRLSPDVVLVTYRTDTPSLRTSIWSRGGEGAWRLLHHHGTRTAEPAPPAAGLAVPDLATLHARRSEKWSGPAPDVLPSTVAEMDFPVAPAVAAALHAAVARSDLGYVAPEQPRFAAAFAGFAARRLGWSVDPARVTLVPDVMAGLIELCRVIAPPGARVGFVTPGYPPFFAELPQAGVALVPLPASPAGCPDLGALESALAQGLRVLVLANPHNPTGRVLPHAELARIAELCAAHGAWVLADEVHAPLVLDGAPHTPWLEVSDAAREHGIALTSASKAFNLAGLKTALLVTASDAAQAVVRRLPPLSDRVGLFGVIAGEAAFADGDEWLDAVRRQLLENRSLLRERLQAELPAVRWTPPDASFLAWLDCRALGLGDDPAATFLARGRIALSPGLDYGREGAGFVRLNFGTSPEHVADAVRRLAAAL